MESVLNNEAIVVFSGGQDSTKVHVSFMQKNISKKLNS